MSNTPEDTTTSTPTSLGMATSTMVLNHIDYASPFMGKMFLLIIDAHSKWLDIHIPNSSNTQSTVEKLHMTFANHGLPEMVVSGNGPAFVSKEFEEFMEKKMEFDM